MAPAPCTWIDEHPDALGERPLPAHLSTCERCRTRFDVLEKALRKAFNPPPVPFPPELEARILAAVAADGRKRRRSRFRPAAFGLSLAAAAAFLLFIFWPKPPQNFGSPHMKAPEEPTGPAHHKPTSGCACAF